MPGLISVPNDGGYSIKRPSTDHYLVQVDPVWWHTIASAALVFKSKSEAEWVKHQLIRAGVKQ